VKFNIVFVNNYIISLSGQLMITDENLFGFILNNT